MVNESNNHQNLLNQINEIENRIRINEELKNIVKKYILKDESRLQNQDIVDKTSKICIQETVKRNKQLILDTDKDIQRFNEELTKVKFELGKEENE